MMQLLRRRWSLTSVFSWWVGGCLLGTVALPPAQAGTADAPPSTMAIAPSPLAVVTPAHASHVSLTEADLYVGLRGGLSYLNSAQIGGALNIGYRAFERVGLGIY